MDRKDWYFKQKVTEAELDSAFEAAEVADRFMMVDNEIFGVCSGLEITQQPSPNLTVRCLAGVAYDKLGQRMEVLSTQNVDCSVDFNNVSTAVVGGGNSKYIAIFLKFTRDLSDPRTDGNSNTVYFQRDEAYEFKVVQSAEAPTPTRPPLEGDAILLAVLTRAFGQTTFQTADIDMDVLPDSSIARELNFLLQATQAVDVVTAVPTTWANAATIAATNVEAALNEIVADLAASGASAGTGKIGGAQFAASLLTLPTGTLRSQIEHLFSREDLEYADFKWVDHLDSSGTGSLVQTVTSTSMVAVDSLNMGNVKQFSLIVIDAEYMAQVAVAGDIGYIEVRVTEAGVQQNVTAVEFNDTDSLTPARSQRKFGFVHLVAGSNPAVAVEVRAKVAAGGDSMDILAHSSLRARVIRFEL